MELIYFDNKCLVSLTFVVWREVIRVREVLCVGAGVGEGELLDQTAVSALPLVQAVETQSTSSVTNYQPQTLPNDRESTNVPSGGPHQVDRGECSALAESIRHLCRQVSSAGRHHAVDVSVPAALAGRAPLLLGPVPGVQLEDVDRLGVGGTRQERPTRREGQ